MSSNDMSLDERMKRYENVSRTYLTRRVPVIIRIDGKAFHTFTKGLKKPFDEVMAKSMHATMQMLCKSIQGCVFGYTQSDEITLILTDYNTIDTDAWFGNKVQKICSISSSMATLFFNRAFTENTKEVFSIHSDSECNAGVVDVGYLNALSRCLSKGAMFDSRCFSVPKDEVCNCLIWRQQDATRNSIEAVGQANFSSKQLHEKTCSMIKEMLIHEKGIDWNDLPTEYKRGASCYKKPVEVKVPDYNNPGESTTVMRNKWCIDYQIPVFSEDREYIERWL